MLQQRARKQNIREREQNGARTYRYRKCPKNPDKNIRRQKGTSTAAPIVAETPRSRRRQGRAAGLYLPQVNKCDPILYAQYCLSSGYNHNTKFALPKTDENVENFVS